MGGSAAVGGFDEWLRWLQWLADPVGLAWLISSVATISATKLRGARTPVHASVDRGPWTSTLLGASRHKDEQNCVVALTSWPDSGSGWPDSGSEMARAWTVDRGRPRSLATP